MSNPSIIYNFLDKLRRVTSSTQFIREIDGLRFFAIITVVLLHLNTHFSRTSEAFSNSNYESPFTWVVNKGLLGVYVFFAISGFILALPFANHYINGTRKPKLADYFIRRLTRLEPPYIISLVLFYLVWVFVMHSDSLELLPHFFASLLYLHYFIYDDFSPINSVSWSLETEVQFYVLAPLLAMLFLVKPTWLRRAAIVVGIIVIMLLRDRFKQEMDDYHLEKSILTYFPLFLTGFLFAEVYLTAKAFFQKEKSFFWDLLGIIGTIGLYFFCHSYRFDIRIFFILSLFLVFLGAFKGVVLNWFYTRKFVTVTDGMCYTIYLLHYPFVALVLRFTKGIQVGSSYELNYLIQAAIVLPLLFLVSSAFFLLIEKPCMHKDWHIRLWNTIKERLQLSGKKVEDAS